MTKYTIEPMPDWKLRILNRQGLERILTIQPPEPVSVTGEKHENVSLYIEKKWRIGFRFDQLKAMECSIAYSLLPDSVALKKTDGTLLKNGVDYLVDPVWGACGRLPDSGFGENDTVFADYSYVPNRIDAVIRKGDDFFVRCGTANGANPVPPQAEAGEELICTIYFDRNRRYFTNSMVFQFHEPYSPPQYTGDAERQLKNTLRKLRNGEKVRILFWGDSMTACLFIADETKRWPAMVTEELRRRFPNAKIEPVVVGWPGKKSRAFFAEPPGSIYNYKEKVVDSGADLVFVEFTNDADLVFQADFDAVYNRIRDDFAGKNMESVYILPHFVRPDWMGLTTQKDIEEDPRPYIKLLRKFTCDNDFACADVSARFLHLWKEGFPYNALMLNNINHPNQQGVDYYRDAVCSLLPIS